MAKKSLTYHIFNDLSTAVSGIAKKVYLDRPKTTESEITDFIVVDLPTVIHNRVKGDMSVMAGCYGVYYVFVKSKDDYTPNMTKQTSLVQSVLDVFPISTSHITATEPTVLMKGEDGYGYHVTTITFKVRTKFNADKITNTN